MFSASIIGSVIAGLWGSSAFLGWLMRIGVVPFLPVISKVFELAFDLASIVLRGLGGAIAKSFESVWGVLLLAAFFYGGAWHFAEWRPWHGFSKEKAAPHLRVATPAASAPKVAPKRQKSKTDTRSIFERNFNPF